MKSDDENEVTATNNCVAVQFAVPKRLPTINDIIKK